MAVNDWLAFEYHPRIPSPEELAERLRVSRITVTYNPLADELLVLWDLPAKPAVSVFFDDPDWLAYRLDPDTHDVVGFHILDYLHRAVREYPELLELAKPAEIPAELVEIAYQNVPEEEHARAAVRVLACLAASS